MCTVFITQKICAECGTVCDVEGHDALCLAASRQGYLDCEKRTVTWNVYVSAIGCARCVAAELQRREEERKKRAGQ
ncbi:hypothetical protein ACJZ2D_011141 [Fusarium nematophilum]